MISGMSHFHIPSPTSTSPHLTSPHLTPLTTHPNRLAATYQSSMDSVLNYPMYDALVEGFAIPGPGNMTAVTETLVALQGQMKVCFLSFFLRSSFPWACYLLALELVCGCGSRKFR